MIHVAPAEEPATFDATVRRRGLLAIAEMTGKPPPHRRTAGRSFKQRTRTVVQADGTTVEINITQEVDLPSSEFPVYWTEALDDLMEAYGHVCAYSCFRIHPVTGSRSVDHMAPKSRAWDRVYEWTNYRLACSLLNARKREFDDVLDPFEVRNGWFVIDLVGFQVLPSRSLGASTRAQVQDTIDRLGLDDFRSSRERDAENYWAGKVSFEVLMEESPFVAMELRRQNRLREDERS